MSRILLKTEVGGFLYTLYLQMELIQAEDGSGQMTVLAKGKEPQTATIPKADFEAIWGAAEAYRLFELPQSPEGVYEDFYRYSITLHVNHQGKEFIHKVPEGCDQQTPPVETTEEECVRYLSFSKKLIDLIEQNTSIRYPPEMKRRW